MGTLKKIPPTWELKIEKHHLEGDVIEPVTLSVQAFTKGEARAAFKKVMKEIGESIHLPEGFVVRRGPDPVAKPFDRNDVNTLPPHLAAAVKAVGEFALNRPEAILARFQPKELVVGNAK